MGELAVGAAWALVVIGAAYVAHGGIAPGAIAVAPGFGLLAVNLLINEMPDAAADAAGGKRTGVVLLGAVAAARLYGAIALAAHASLIAGVTLGMAPRRALVAAAGAPFAFAACVLVAKHAAQPRQLAPAIKLTILAALTYGMGAAAGFALN